MEEKNKVPMLLEFLFGEAAETAPAITAGLAQQGASPRLTSRWERDKAWGEAFDEWMAEQGRRCKPNTSKQAKITWRQPLSGKATGRR